MMPANASSNGATLASPRVLVVGAGVSGLTTALALRRDGFEVTVLAEHFAPRVTSVVAGALWEWPPAVCRQEDDQESLARAKGWCQASYEAFADLARVPTVTGVYMRTATFYFRHSIEKDSRHLRKMTELREHVREFVHDPGLIAQNGVNSSGLRDAYSHLTPTVDTDAYLAWLLLEARRTGCRIIEGKLVGRLRDQELMLRREYRVEAVVNCTGLGARELTGDEMFPLRGALVRVVNDGKRFPRVSSGHCVAHDGAENDPGFVFIVPRGSDRLLLGGIAEPNQWGLDIGLHNHEPVRAMLRRCVQFLPVLEGAELDAAEPVRVGLRPFRTGSVRLEREPGTSIVHNYGHGGAGVTLSWGCALEVAGLVREMLASRSDSAVRPS